MYMHIYIYIYIFSDNFQNEKPGECFVESSQEKKLSV